MAYRSISMHIINEYTAPNVGKSEKRVNKKTEREQTRLHDDIECADIICGGFCRGG
jgi:hypothetical protein